jgi:hypothetical protein
VGAKLSAYAGRHHTGGPVTIIAGPTRFVPVNDAPVFEAIVAWTRMPIFGALQELSGIFEIILKGELNVIRDGKKSNSKDAGDEPRI